MALDRSDQTIVKDTGGVELFPPLSDILGLVQSTDMVDFASATGDLIDASATAVQVLTSKTIDGNSNTLSVKRSVDDIGNPVTASDLVSALGAGVEGSLYLINDNADDDYQILVAFHHSKWWFLAMSEAVDYPTFSVPTSDGKYVSAAPDIDWTD